MKKLVFKIKMILDKEEMLILTKALDLYVLASTTFEYPDEIEICKDVSRKIRRGLSTEYIENREI